MMLNPEGTQSVFEMEDGLLKSKSTCALVGEFGSKVKHPRAESVLKLHDQFVLNDDDHLHDQADELSLEDSGSESSRKP